MPTIQPNAVSDLGDFNNCRCDYGPGTPTQTIIDKSAIEDAQGSWVVSGISATDGSIYRPWIAVQDSEDQLIDSRVSNTVAFRGRHNLNSTTKEGAVILFSTSGPKTDQNTPTMTKRQAMAWFSKAEAQQAKKLF
jgi:Tfp pilus assembly protein FimT